MHTDLTPERLIRRLEAAFAPVPYPGEDALLAHDCPASRSLREDLYGLPAGRVPDLLVVRHYDGMSFLSPGARRYYFPAYARTALRQPQSDVAEFLLYTLAGDLEWQLEGGFTPQQRAAVVALLEYLPRQMDRIFSRQITDALERWKTILPLAQAA